MLQTVESRLQLLMNNNVDIKLRTEYTRDAEMLLSKNAIFSSFFVLINLFAGCC